MNDLKLFIDELKQKRAEIDRVIEALGVLEASNLTGFDYRAYKKPPEPIVDSEDSALSRKKSHLTPDGRRRLSAALRLRHKKIREAKARAAEDLKKQTKAAKKVWKKSMDHNASVLRRKLHQVA